MTNDEVDEQLAENLKARLKTLRSKFIEMDSGDTLFEDIRLMLRKLDEDPFSEKLD
ncbi:hypothetical protein HKX54_08075 [Sulfitobacter sp. M57]|uniref:hypothetical protein n=1 Tax=unclassified Sulfitobacter TaxID=196795 RepID=UPI0023E33CB2|nr:MULTISPECIES: hypothetical protein [unclassified Sulfitobacter]MDF3414408.1 hypothetical protein [Sulfitobacter sp. KE5]MDF3420310.1 hypothetical protein [Sulfitobacter sp. KE43]MDF3432954.1 hypothetical protein [Sulfitobacter sp. KE42]MDF3458594.1 hypothetical protein [Sulfitobacter sp. S74]MDF3462494.1 hypothetical protein [Sulfitobacter sp. Ks18]